MNGLSVGYAQVNIDPPLGIDISGYYVPRFAKGYLDQLQAGALALSHGATTVLLLSVDILGIDFDLSLQFRQGIADAAGIPVEHIFLSATHSHTAASLNDSTFPAENLQAVEQYIPFLGKRLCDAALLAIADQKPAKMGYCVASAPDRIAYIRRYKMKDGSTMTCPPIDDPNIDHPIGTLDQRVNVLRFDQDSGNSIVLVNYGIHCDTIGGELLSADFPAWLRSTVEKALDGAKCLFFAGAQGDVGSTNVHPGGGDMNDTEISFDNEMKSPGMARFVGRALAGTVLQVYDKVSYVDVDRLAVLNKTANVPANMPAPEDLPLAHKYRDLHEAGREDEIPYTAMELTTVVAEALRMCKLEHGPEFFRLGLTAVAIGPVALVGFPGEPFTDIGVAVKEAPGWELILPCALTNGNEGYFPMQSAYDEGGYESRTSRYKADIAELLIDNAKVLLDELRAK